VLLWSNDAPAKSRNSQFRASGDRRTTNDFKWLQPSQRTLRCSPVPARKNLLFAGDSKMVALYLLKWIMNIKAGKNYRLTP